MDEKYFIKRSEFVTAVSSVACSKDFDRWDIAEEDHNWWMEEEIERLNYRVKRLEDKINKMFYKNSESE